jgi:hypothetical protein
MKFKIADLAVVNKDNPNLAPYIKGDIVTILAIYPADMFMNREDHYKVEDMTGQTYQVYESDLDEMPLELPLGLQMFFGLDPKACDCGGWKAYNSMDPVYHSKSLPCSSLVKK